MTQNNGTVKPVAVMFAAVAEPARLYERHGNDGGWRLVSECLSLMSELSQKYGGRIIKTVGEEIICVFSDASRSALACNEIQEAVRKCGLQSELSESHLRARIGVHWGTVIDEGDDIFGDTVNTAARLMGFANSAQIFVSGELIEELPALLKSTARFIDDVPLRGKTTVIRVFELVWEVTEATTMAGVTDEQLRVQQRSCTIEHLDGTWELEGANASLRIGRGDTVDVRCLGAPVSREHARIEYHRGRFVLTDQSVNGTYVRPDDEPLLRLRREQFNLRGSGTIGVGQLPDEEPQLTLRYRCD